LSIGWKKRTALCLKFKQQLSNSQAAGFAQHAALAVRLRIGDVERCGIKVDYKG